MAIAIIIIVCHNGNTMRQLPQDSTQSADRLTKVEKANEATKNKTNNQNKS